MGIPEFDFKGEIPKYVLERVRKDLQPLPPPHFLISEQMNYQNILFLFYI